MSDIPDALGKVTEKGDLLGKIRGFLSGFVGYVERDQRREADKILRESVADRYQEQWERLSSLQRTMIEEGALEDVDRVEAAALKLRAFIDRVRGASYGYAGFFDHVRIGKDELAKMYEYDLALLEKIGAVASAIDNVEGSLGTDGLPAALRHLEGLCQEVVEAYDRRDEVVVTS